MQRIVGYIMFFAKVRITAFFYLNYFCKSVIRMDKSKIIPYKNAIIDISKDAKIYLKNGDIEIGSNLLRKSRAETLVRIHKDAKWISNGGCSLAYGTTLEILPGGMFESGFFTTNSNCVIIISHKMVFGNDVMLGRNVIIYDSDHHQILNGKNEIVNLSKPVRVGNHVWIATNVMILKGAKIGNNCVIGSKAIIRQEIMENTIYVAKQTGYIKENDATWARKSPNKRQ